MFGVAPVMQLSTQTTSWPSAMKRSQRCEPTKPAPPVIKVRIRLVLVFEKRIEPESTSGEPIPGCNGQPAVGELLHLALSVHSYQQGTIRSAPDEMRFLGLTSFRTRQ